MAPERDFSSSRRRARVPSLESAAVAAGAVALAWSLYTAGDAWAGHRRVRDSLARAQASVEQAGARVDALDRRRGPGDAFVSQAVLTLEAAPPQVLAALSSLLPADVKLDAISMRYGPRLEVDMEVTARHPGAYDAFLERLAGSPLFGEVLPGDENRQGEVRSTVRAVYRGGVE